MKEGWNLQRLDEVMLIERGGSPRPIDKYITNDPNGINWIKISDATSSNKYIYATKEKISKDGLGKTRIVYEDDFILSNSMSFGRPYIMKTTGCIHDGWLVLRKRNGVSINTDYLYHLLSSPFVFKQFDTLAAGSTVRNLNIGLVSSVKVPIPSILEQQRIVNILEEAFTAIDQAKANVERNLQNAKELFQSELNSIFSNKGEGWVEKKLGDVSKINYGYTEKSSYDEIGPKFLRITDIQDNGVDWETVPYCKCSLEDLPKYCLESGDIVFARTGATTGKSYLIESPPKAVFASYLIRLTLKSKSELLPEFVHCYFKTKIYWDCINSGISGSAQGGFNASKLSDIIISYPISIKKQQAIVDQLNILSVQTKNLEKVYRQKLNALDDLKKSILEKAFNGELKGKEVPV